MLLMGEDGELKNPIPARPAAEALSQALGDLLEARSALEKARAEVPRYTGDKSREDYYAFEQEQANRAADRLLDLVSPGAGLAFVTDHDALPTESGNYWCANAQNGEIFLASLDAREGGEPEWRFLGTKRVFSPGDFQSMHLKVIARLQPPALVEASAEDLTGPRP
jgi:hypothetical protein